MTARRGDRPESGTGGLEIERRRSGPALAVPALQAAAESLWFSALTLAIVALTKAPVEPSPLAIGGLEVAAVLVTKLGARTPRRFALDRLLLLPAGLGLTAGWVLLLTVGVTVDRTAFTLLWLLGSTLVVRGVILGLEDSPARKEGWFLHGMIAFALLFAFFAGAKVKPAELPMTALKTLAILYVVLGLGITALAHRQVAARALGARASLSPSWALGIALPIVCLVAAAVFFAHGTAALRFAGEVALEVAAALGHAIRWLAAILWLVFRFLASVLPKTSGSGRTGHPPEPGPVADHRAPRD
jgi:hypothetical protein